MVQKNLFNEQPLICRQSIQSLMDLATFFFTASLRNDLNYESRIAHYGIQIINEKEMDSDFDNYSCDRFFNFDNEVEILLANEFIEPLNKS